MAAARQQDVAPNAAVRLLSFRSGCFLASLCAEPIGFAFREQLNISQMCAGWHQQPGWLALCNACGWSGLHGDVNARGQPLCSAAVDMPSDQDASCINDIIVQGAMGHAPAARARMSAGCAALRTRRELSSATRSYYCDHYTARGGGGVRWSPPMGACSCSLQLIARALKGH